MIVLLFIQSTVVAHRRHLYLHRHAYVPDQGFVQICSHPGPSANPVTRVQCGRQIWASTFSTPNSRVKLQ